MFCTKCGKELYEGDRFCAFCGAEVRNRIPSKNDEVVFNPPFKIEAQKKTEEILKAVEERKEEAAKKETVAFNWNLEGFPAAQPKKTEDVDFNWDSVLERKNKNQPQPRYTEQKLFADRTPEIPQEPATMEFEIPRQPAIMPKFERKQPPAEEEKMSVEELEKELFGTADKPKDDRFFTFNQKNDEFQQLLDKEKERVQNMEAEYNRQFAEMDYTWVPEVFPVKHRSEQKTEPKTEPKAEPKTEPRKEAESKEEPAKDSENAADTVLIGVAQPVTPNTVDFTIESLSPREARAENIPTAKAPSEKENATAEKKPTGGETADATPSESASAEKSPTEKTPAENAPAGSDKLRYSDIFPRVDGKSDSGSVPGYNYNEDNEEPVKKHTVLKVLVTILIIALAVEAGILAIKFFAPESKASEMINNTIFKVADLFTGSSEQGTIEVPEGGEEDLASGYLSNIVTEKSAGVKTIGSVIYNPELVYDKNKTYSFEEISSADEFVDGQWEGMNATYGEKLLETIIKHYDEWLSTNTDESLVGINTLEIGEIKTGQKGFYTLCKVTFAKADGSEVSSLQTVYTVISDELMVINEIKEESL